MSDGLPAGYDAWRTWHPWEDATDECEECGQEDCTCAELDDYEPYVDLEYQTQQAEQAYEASIWRARGYN